MMLPNFPIIKLYQDSNYQDSYFYTAFDFLYRESSNAGFLYPSLIGRSTFYWLLTCTGWITDQHSHSPKLTRYSIMSKGRQGYQLQVIRCEMSLSRCQGHPSYCCSNGHTGHTERVMMCATTAIYRGNVVDDSHIVQPYYGYHALCTD